MKRSPLILLTLAVVASSSAQQTPSLPPSAAAVKRTADSLSPQAKISVVRVHNAEQYGEFLSNDMAGFTFYDIDQKQNVTLTYAEVKKIKRGYGGYNSLHKKHTDRTRNTIVILVVVGALAGIIAAAAVAK